MTSIQTPDVKIAVVIVTYNGAPWIDQCIRSVAAQGVNALTIVVDNASSDDTCLVLQRSGLATTLIQSNNNIGFGAGNNLGIRRALDEGADFVFLLNQDAYLLEGCLSALIAFMDERQDIGIAAPLHYSPDSTEIDRRTFRGYLQCYVENYLCDAVLGRVQRSYPIHGVNAAGWCVRASVFQEYGGFDPLFFMYGEDDDLLQRWAFHRIKFELLPEAKMVHLRQSPASPKSSYWRQIWLGSERYRSELLKVIKNPKHSLAHMIAVLVAKGFIAPLADALVLRDWSGLLKAELAAARLVIQLPQVFTHARLSAQRGDHYL
jgi:GT2 family glycosyltransferase